MSHAALVNAGLFYIVVVQPILLVLFIRAVIRAPAGPVDSPSHEPEQPEPQVSALPQPPQPARLPVRAAAWPPSSAVGQPDEADYVGRHIAQGGPPWGPAPKPPGASR
jgi:hypothetical protein